MKKVLLVLSVAALTLTSCSKEEIVDCNCGTVIGLWGDSNGYLVRVVSDCETNPNAHDGGVDSPEWTFVEDIGLNPYNIEQQDTYCASEPKF